MNPLRTVARAMLAALYIDSGWRAYRHPERLAETAKPITDRVAPLLTAVHPNAPTDAQTLVKFNGVAQMVGGVMLATGNSARPGALILAATHLPTTLAGPRFWETQDPTQKAEQRTQFLKNLSMVGGLLIAALDTEGRPGLAWRTSHLASTTKKSVGRTTRDTRRSIRRATEDTQRTVLNAAHDTQRSVLGAAHDAQRSVLGAAQDAQRTVNRASRKAKRSVSRAKVIAATKAGHLTGS